MSNEPQEPPCPEDRVPHPERVRKINEVLPAGKTAAICIDNTPEHIAWYLHEIAKYPKLIVLSQGVLDDQQYIYAIKVTKRETPVNPCVN